MTAVVGPLVCGGCSGLVWWAKAVNGKGMGWRDRDGRKHACGGAS